MIKIIPSAKNVLKIIPIYESLFNVLRADMNWIKMAAINPNMDAPTSMLIPSMYDIATPGKTAWERASPINAIFLKTIKLPIIPDTTPRIIAESPALRI